jgi:hypothetical protein
MVGLASSQALSQGARTWQASDDGIRIRFKVGRGCTGRKPVVGKPGRRKLKQRTGIGTGLGNTNGGFSARRASAGLIESE